MIPTSIDLILIRCEQSLSLPGAFILREQQVIQSEFLTGGRQSILRSPSDTYRFPITTTNAAMTSLYHRPHPPAFYSQTRSTSPATTSLSQVLDLGNSVLSELSIREHGRMQIMTQSASKHVWRRLADATPCVFWFIAAPPELTEAVWIPDSGGTESRPEALLTTKGLQIRFLTSKMRKGMPKMQLVKKSKREPGNRAWDTGMPQGWKAPEAFGASVRTGFHKDCMPHYQATGLVTYLLQASFFVYKME